jgi:hypothetical protein
MAKKKSVRKARRSEKKPVRAKKPLRARKPAPTKKLANAKKRVRGKSETANRLVLERKGLGADAAGQSGDIEGLSGTASADSESVAELVEEGQSFEAGVVRGVEDAPDPDESEVTTHEVPEDDVPSEYDDK